MNLDEILKTKPIAYGRVQATAYYVDADAELDMEALSLFGLENTGRYRAEVKAALEALTPETIRTLDFEFADNWGDYGAYTATITRGDFDLTVALLLAEELD